jgi:hypothetical protein
MDLPTGDLASGSRILLPIDHQPFMFETDGHKGWTVAQAIDDGEDDHGTGPEDRTLNPPDSRCPDAAEAGAACKRCEGAAGPSLRPPKGAPNVLIVLIDDMGFGATSTIRCARRAPQLGRQSRQGSHVRLEDVHGC